jgi:hypothetical protein
MSDDDRRPSESGYYWARMQSKWQPVKFNREMYHVLVPGDETPHDPGDFEFGERLTEPQ